jgi:RNA recognition motif-containing protein
MDFRWRHSSIYLKGCLFHGQNSHKNTKDISMNKNLYVGNLSTRVTEEDLRVNFSSAGKVVSVNIIKDRLTGQSKGFGFVEMETEEGASEAIKKFNGGQLDGNNIIVSEARPKRDRGARPHQPGRGAQFRGGRGKRF